MKYSKPDERNKSEQTGGADAIGPPALRKRGHPEVKSEPGNPGERKKSKQAGGADVMGPPAFPDGSEGIVNDTAKPRSLPGAAVGQTRTHLPARSHTHTRAKLGEAENSFSPSTDVRVWSGGEQIEAADSGPDVEWQAVRKAVPGFVPPIRL